MKTGRDPIQRAGVLAAGLDQALGDNLVSLILYGSAARGAHQPHRSDINTLLIMRDASAAALRPIGPVIASWVAGGDPPPLIFSEADWRSGADVFPIEIEDMRAAHRILRGVDPFVGLVTTRDDLRRELEREARGKLVQLRARYAAAESDGDGLADLLLASSGTFFALMRAALRLEGRTPPAGPAELVAQTATLAGLASSAFAWVIARQDGGRPRRLRPYDAVGAEYVDQVARFVAWVDQAFGKEEHVS